MSILILGQNGQVGWELCRALQCVANVTALDRSAIDVTNEEYLRNFIRHTRPSVIINATGFNAVDEAERRGELAQIINAEVPRILAQEAERLGSCLIHYSTDYVFNGAKVSPYTEKDLATPLNVYGQTKLAGEQAIECLAHNHIILRCSWIYSIRRTNFLLSILEAALQKNAINVIDDCYGAPTAASLIADVTASIVRQISERKHCTEVSGVYHLSSSGATSWHEYASFVVDEGRRLQMPLRLESSAIKPISEKTHRSAARRPLNSRMSTEKLRQTFGIVLPEWQWGVHRTLEEIAQILRSGNFLVSSKPRAAQ